MTSSYKKYVSGGPAELTRKAGIEEYSFDIANMTQMNLKTRKEREIRCRLEVPGFWRSCKIEDIYHKTKAPRVKLESIVEQQSMGRMETEQKSCRMQHTCRT